MKKSFTEFPISVYGQLEPVNDILSKARVRIFYRGGNRNGTYITDEFAEELVNTLYGVPVKGIYDGEDFTDHGEARNEGQIYGFVPETNNFAWETHVDEDGVERTYACCDVYLFTALFPEASEIVGKSQSMELYEPSLKYHVAIMDGQRYVVFDHGCFLGVQVLGDEVEPCFEGASFYTLQKSIQDTIQKIKEYSKIGGKSEMPKLTFKLSDSQKYEALWTLLNPNCTEEGEWAVDCSICDVYDDYALVYTYETGSYERVYYTKDEASDSINIGDRVKVYVIDVTENEKHTLDALRTLNGGTYELVNENLANAENNAAQCAEFSTKIDELNITIATLNTEASEAQVALETANSQYAEAQAQIATLTENITALETYKKNIENQHKEAVMAEYADKLSEEVLDAYKAKVDEYTVEDLDMHLAYELKKLGTFSINTNAPSGVLPKDTERSGVDAILARYTK